jgi:DNA-binding response OmpR family regulator
VILDIKMQGLSGFDVLSWVRNQQQFSRLHVIILSGSSLEEDRVEAAQLGADAYFAKTPLFEDVVEYVEKFIHDAMFESYPTTGTAHIMAEHIGAAAPSLP